MKKGHLTMIVGPMFSGKTDELIRCLEASEKGGAKVIAFKPGKDTRTGSFLKTRRFDAKFEAFTVETAEELLAVVSDEHRVVGIEEIQFFDAAIVEAVRTLIARGKRVIAAGLNTDFEFRPFKPEVVGALMCLAEKIIIREAVCVDCHEPATRSGRTVESSQLVLVGDQEYKAQCRNCHRA